MGAGRSVGSLGLSSIRSVRIGGRGGGGSATMFCALFADRLPLLLPLPPKRVVLRLLEVEEERSRPASTSFLSLLNALLNRRPGDAPRFFAPLSSGTNVGAGCVEGLGGSASVLDSDAVALGPLTADSTSPCTPSVSVASAEVV